MNWIVNTVSGIAIEEQTIVVVPSAETEEALGRSTATISPYHTSSVRLARINYQFVIFAENLMDSSKHLRRRSPHLILKVFKPIISKE